MPNLGAEGIAINNYYKDFYEKRIFEKDPAELFKRLVGLQKIISIEKVPYCNLSQAELILLYLDLLDRYYAMEGQIISYLSEPLYEYSYILEESRLRGLLVMYRTQEIKTGTSQQLQSLIKTTRIAMTNLKKAKGENPEILIEKYVSTHIINQVRINEENRNNSKT